MELFEAIQNRKSVRAYTDRPVDRALIAQVVEAGILAPTGKNSQTRRFIVMQDQDKLQALLRAVIGAAELSESYTFYNAPALILVVDEAADYNACSNCACAMQNMMLAATGLGLGAVWINQIGPVSDDSAVRAELDAMGLPASQKIWAALALGYEGKPTSPREKNRDVVTWV